MKLKFNYAPQTDNRYGCVDIMHLEIDTIKRTYASYEDQTKGEGIYLKRKVDIIDLIMKVEEEGYARVERSLA